MQTLNGPSIILLSLLQITSCTTINTETTQQTQRPSPNTLNHSMTQSDTAKPSVIVFLADTRIQTGMRAALYDVTHDEPIFIGAITKGQRVTYDTPPGKRVFMIMPDVADFMEIDVDSGQVHYSVVSTNWGEL